MPELQTSLMVAAGAMVLALVTGKTIRTIVYRILARLSEKTETHEDDIVVEAIREDWSLPDNVVDLPKKDQGK